MKIQNVLCVGLIAGAASVASAGLVQVDVVGSVDFNQINFGAFAGSPSGTPATMSFRVDSDVFADSMMFPTRGYDIIASTFTLTVGSNTVGLANPYPAGATPTFVLRDNDPAVDGFFLGSSPDVGFPNGVTTDEPGGIADNFQALFQATYTGSTLNSLNILDALGTYDFTNLTVFNWGAEDGPFQPLGLIFDYFTISEVPAPGSLALFAAAPLALVRRRRD
ncbi:MAG: hypothetical protein KDA21_06085 [Phycisphaerales bacterium]|nr:hypothetical protein [Phycisphaerales bacterium]